MDSPGFFNRSGNQTAHNEAPKGGTVRAWVTKSADLLAIFETDELCSGSDFSVVLVVADDVLGRNLAVVGPLLHSAARS